MSEYERLVERQVSSEEIFDGSVLHVKKDTVKLPDGSNAFRELIRHIGAVCVIPVTDDGNVIVERQFRYPIDRVVLEIPAGKLNFRDEDRLEAAKRELEEETGYTASEWTDIGLYYPAPAYSDEKITMYLARGLKKGAQHLDEDEFLEVDEIPLEKLVRDVMEGKITDGKTQIAVLKAFHIINGEK
ncbi:MAG: NUDIX domain-containing protein [Lachnospiraceae bacterium]|jgi:ADP-ribose pyrophosphatase